MKNLLSFCIYLITLTTVVATEIKVPVILNQPKSSGIRQLGFYKDNDKYVWAVVSDHFKDISSKKRLTVCFYLNADNDKQTGRFPGKAGYDLQFNVTLAPVKFVGLMSWTAGVKRAAKLPVYPDDYTFKVTDNILYLSIKKSIFGKHPIHDKYTLRVMFGGYPAVSSQVNSTVVSSKTIMPPMNFIRFGENISVRHKSPYAEIISNKEGVTVWNSFMDRYEPREKFPTKSKKIKLLSMSAARGEAESLQLGITTAQVPEKVSLTASDLTGSDGEKISASQIEIEYVGYVIDAYSKSYGDVLLPAYKAEDALNNFILLTVKVPVNASAGIYHGNLNLKVNGKFSSTLPLELRVYDFSLPETPSFLTAFAIKTSYVSAFFRAAKKPINSQQVRKQVEALRQLCSKYRIGPRFLGGGLGVTIENGKLKFNWSKFDQALEKFFKIDKFAGFQLTSRIQFGSHGKMYTTPPFFNKNHPPSVDDPVFQKLWPQYIKAIYERLQKKNYLNRTLFVVWDEPYNNWHQIKTLSKLAKQGAPDIKLGVFISHYEPKIADAIDIWLTPATSIGAIYKSGEKRKIWLYNDGRMGSFTNPASDIRGCFWQAWQYKLQGFINSEVDAWTRGWSKSFDKYHNSAPTHMWFYPDLNGGNPLPSLRLALIRDGVDDYDYFKLFATKLATARAKNHPGLKEAEVLWLKLKKVMPKLNKQNKIDFKMDSIVTLNKWRDKIAEQIIKLSK